MVTGAGEEMEVAAVGERERETIKMVTMAMQERKKKVAGMINMVTMATSYMD